VPKGSALRYINLLEIHIVKGGRYPYVYYFTDMMKKAARKAVRLMEGGNIGAGIFR
jgi:predicted SnoaL-like aldol condensation-catalyzing enzyme